MSSTLQHSGTSRLPSSEPPRKGAGQTLLGVLALLGTAVIVVGVPIALLAVFGAPWPSEAPSVEWLTSPTTTETVMAVLAAVVWLAWLHFVVCLAVEVVAAISRRGISPSVPGGGLGTQKLARNLVVTIMLLLGTTAATIGPAAAADPEVGSGPSTVSSQIETSQATGGAVATAATAQVSASEDNAPQQAQESGKRRGPLPAPDDLEQGTKADVRAGVTTYYEVKPPRDRHYDTLWDIAERYLGDGLRYKEIVEINRGLKQADGTELTNPDLIYPGWVLRLPDDAKGPGLRVVDHADAAPPPGSAGGGNGGVGAAQTGADSSDAELDGAAAGSDEGAGAVMGRVADVVDGDWAPLFGVAGGLALGGAFLALRRRRATMPVAQLWASAAGAPPDPDPTPDGPGGGPGGGARLRDEADPAMASWLDRALRGSDIGGNTPAPAQVSVGAGGLAMAFAEAPLVTPPQGWVGVNDRVWALAADAAFTGSGPAPTPGLVTIGRRDDDSLLLIDPEAVPGVVALEGPDDIARGVAMSMAIDTATHPWADQRAVTMVGFADDVTAAGAGNLHRVDDLGRVLENLENLARYHRGACRQVGAKSAREARVAAPMVADWSYQLVVCSGVPSAAELTRLHNLAADPQVALGVVVIGAAPSAEMRLAAQPDGRLTSPIHSIDVQAQTLDVGAVRTLMELYAPPPGRGVTFEEWAERVADEAIAVAVDESTVRIGVLGPVTIDAPGEVEQDRRPFLTELACYLALHPDGVHVNRLTGALWPRGVGSDSRDAALRQLGTWLGTSADGEPVLREESGVWSLLPGAVRLDWDDFRADVNAAGTPGAHREQMLRRALSHVRGLPFADVPAGRYSWLETTATESDILLAIIFTALAASDAAIERDDAGTARAVLARTLQLAPSSEDLWRARLRLEARFGSPDDVAVIADSLYEALAEHGAPYGPTGETDALVAELLPGYRRKVA